MTYLKDALDSTDWPLFAAQKLALIEAITIVDEHTPNQYHKELLEGLLHWIDAMQDAADRDGFPVVYLME